MMRKVVRFLGMVAMGAAVATAAMVGLANDAVNPVPRSDQWWMQRHQSMNERVKQGNVDLIFIGDSITHGWEGAGKEVWEAYYGHRNAVNLGIGGDRTQHVLWRLDNGNIDGINPKLAVIMIGTNNAAPNEPEETAEGIKAILTKLRDRLPKMKIVLLAIFPRGETPEDPLRQKNEKVNKLIAQFCDGEMVKFVDIGAAFLTIDGVLPKDIMPDLLHPNARGYSIWAAAIEPYVAEVLGPLPPPKGEPDAEGFVPLFDGKTIAGWRKAGGNATYWTEDGCIIGKVGPGPNTFLCTERTFTDFILKVEAKFDVPGNSGIQIRSHQRPDTGRVYGYQCEIDPSDRAWSAGIYDEARRGWLFKLDQNEEARKAFKRDDWNEFVIKAEGRRIQTWLNGVPCADFTDESDQADLEGFIALQVHTGKQGQIRWRNIRIKLLEKSE